MEKKEGGALKMAAVVAARRGGGVGGQHGGRHVLGRQQVGEWRGWVGGHATGLGLRPAAGAGTVRHMTGQEEDGERQWGRSAHGVAWVRAIGGVVVARDGAGDVRWVAGGRTERAGAWSVCE